MAFISGRFYRYKKTFRGATRSNLRAGDVDQFSREQDYFPVPKKEFILLNASGDEFDLMCSYEALDNARLEDTFEEVPKPTWWDQPRQALAD